MNRATMIKLSVDEAERILNSKQTYIVRKKQYPLQGRVFLFVENTRSKYLCGDKINGSYAGPFRFVTDVYEQWLIDNKGSDSILNNRVVASCNDITVLKAYSNKHSIKYVYTFSNIELLDNPLPTTDFNAYDSTTDSKGKSIKKGPGSICKVYFQE